MTLFGDGSQTRSFCYVSDLVEGIWRLARSETHEPVNCGNPHEMTIRQFAEEIARHFGLELNVVEQPLPPDDPKVRKPDITRAKAVLDWQPVVPFDEGIAKTIEYFRGFVGSTSH
jgi:dTDP-glucose 4,6-dehydratase